MQQSNLEERVRLLRAYAVVLTIVAILLVLMLLDVTAGTESLYPRTIGQRLGELLTHVALCGYFALSALTFDAYRRNRAIQLDEEFGLLGIGKSGSSSTTSDSVPSADDHSAGPESYRKLHSLRNYSIQCAFPMIVTVLGLSLVFRPPPSDINLDPNVLQALRYGFLGSYVFCLFYVYRRYTTADLVPSVFAYCGIILIAGLAVNYVAFFAISKLTTTLASDETVQEFTGLGAGLTAIVAFTFGYSPHVAIRWFNRIRSQATKQHGRRADMLTLDLIDGINELHETRLRDEGIDNVQNLASANIADLLVSTPFGAQKVIEWIDQAILYAYLEAGELESFRRGGVRCITDFQDYWGPFCFVWKRNDTTGDLFVDPPKPADTVLIDEQRKTLAQKLQSTSERLDSLHRTTRFGPNIAHVSRYWREKEDAAMTVREKHKEDHSKATKEAKEAVHQSLIEGTSATDDSSKADFEFYERLLDDTPEQDISSQLLCNQAWLAYQAGERDEARSLFKKAMRRFPQEPRAYNDLAWILAASEESLDDAIRYANEAVGLRENEPDFLDTLAFALLMKGDDLEEAFKAIEKAIELAEEKGRKIRSYYLHTLAIAAQKFAEKDSAKAQGIVERVRELNESGIVLFPKTKDILEKIASEKVS